MIAARLLLPLLLVALPGPVLGKDKAVREELSAQVLDAVQRCWMPANSLSVTLWVQLAPDGSVLDLDNVALYNEEQALAATRAAVRAVLACEPYDMLDPDLYALWRDLRIAFTP